MTLEDAIQTYHEVLTDELAGESQAQLDNQLQQRGLFFGERPICTVLRPRFLTPEQYQFIQTRVRVLLRAFDKIQRAALAEVAFRAQFHLLDWEDELIQLEPGFRDPVPLSRLDAFFVPHPSGPPFGRLPPGEATEGRGARDELRFTEYNAEIPAASAYNDVLAEIFYALPVMRQFLRHYEVRPQPLRHNVLHALVDAYQQWAGRREAPRIAILDWREVPTYSEFVLFDEYFKSQGLACMIVDPREVEYRQGRLMARDPSTGSGQAFYITLIYKRVLITELIERGGLNHPVVQAVRDGAVCMVNPFRCKILYKKASLAVLSDERNASLFTPDEHQAIEAHIPWTRTVEERQTLYHNQRVDLIPFILEHREWFVLKPNDEYGGKGIVLGWQADPNEWEQAVQLALTTPYIVQERVSIPSEAYPSLVDGQVQLIERMLDTAPYVFYGDYVDGCMTRLSTAALLNVSAGGGSTVPTFVVEKR